MSSVVCVALEERYILDRDGGVWTKSAHNASFFTRYLNAFDKVSLLARGEAGDTRDCKRTDGQCIRFFRVESYSGVLGYFRKRRLVQKAVRLAVENSDAVICRVPGILGSLAFSEAKKQKKPLAVEVVGDPYEAVRWLGLPFMPRIVLMWFAFFRQRWQCRNADAVAYVTQQYLQKRYPPRQQGAAYQFVTTYSSVALPPSVPRRVWAKVDSSEIILICVAGMDQPYKGHDVLLRAFSLLIESGVKARLKLIGDGKCRQDLEEYARKLGVDERIVWRGRVEAGAAVFEELLAADVFVLASRTEGLPRVLIEAMAVGLPCVATDVGGCSELLPKEYIVRAGDAEVFAERLVALCRTRGSWSLVGAKNAEVAQKFNESLVSSRRTETYLFLRSLT